MSKKQPRVGPRHRLTMVVTCSLCQTQRSVRKEKDIPEYCVSCRGKVNGAKCDSSKRKRGENVSCLHCSKIFYKQKCVSDRKYCSKKCADTFKIIHEREIRSCKICNKKFEYAPNKSSNTSGNYCSLPCRNDGYAKFNVKNPETNHRTRWRNIRDKFIKINNFCSACGKKEGRLQVHHIRPYRMNRDNSRQNLVTLCPKHHAAYEKYSDAIEQLGGEAGELLAYMVAAQLQDRWMVYAARN